MTFISIEDFLEVMENDHLDKSSINNARITLNQLNDFKSIEEVEYLDIVKFINHIRDTYGYKESTINIRKAYIIKYFRNIERNDIYEHFSSKHDYEDIDPDTILNPEDINYLLENAKNPMYRALMIYLYESGARINEGLRVKVGKEIKKVSVGYEKLYELTLKGTSKHKSKNIREMYLKYSTPYIDEWLVVRRDDSPYLFPTTDRAVGAYFKRLQKNLNFKKPLNPHMFRHACATRLVRSNMNESLIRKQMGWSKKSNMIERYVHLKPSDLKEHQLRQFCGDTEEVPVVEIIQPKENTSDKVARLEAIVETLMKDKQERDVQIDEQMMLHPEEFESEPVRPDVMPTEKSVDEIKKVMHDFDNDNSPKMIKAKEEAEESRKISPDKLTPISKQ